MTETSSAGMPPARTAGSVSHQPSLRSRLSSPQPPGHCALNNRPYQLGSLLAGERDCIVALVPLSEGGGINNYNGILH